MTLTQDVRDNLTYLATVILSALQGLGIARCHSNYSMMRILSIVTCQRTRSYGPG